MLLCCLVQINTSTGTEVIKSSRPEARKRWLGTPGAPTRLARAPAARARQRRHSTMVGEWRARLKG